MIFHYFLRLFILGCITVYISAVIILRMSIKPDKVWISKIIRRWASLIIKFSSIELKISGIDKLELGKTYIFASNHSSLFDIPVLFAVLPGFLSIVYKKELQKVPVFGLGMKHTPFVPIDRSNARSAYDSLKLAAEILKNGYSLIIYPEGTRSSDGRLQEFKRGAFLLANMTDSEVVPVTLIGTNCIIKKGRKAFNTGTVEVHFGVPLHLDGRSGKEAEQYLQENVRKEMLKYLQE